MVKKITNEIDKLVDASFKRYTNLIDSLRKWNRVMMVLFSIWFIAFMYTFVTENIFVAIVGNLSFLAVTFVFFLKTFPNMQKLSKEDGYIDGMSDTTKAMSNAIEKYESNVSSKGKTQR